MESNEYKDVNISILHIDDDEEFLQISKIYIEKISNNEITVDCISNPLEVFEKLDTKEYDVLISDFKMPEMNGIQLLKKLRENDNHIPFIFLTGKGREEIVIEALNQGADYYVKKGSDMKSLFIEIINNIIKIVIQISTEMALEKERVDLLRTKQRHLTVFETTGTATLIIEEDTIISLVNKQFEKLSGYQKEEIEGKKSWTDFIVEEDLERMKKYHYERREDSSLTPSKYEFRLRDRNGVVKNILLVVGVIVGTKKSVASLTDITERVKSEEILLENEERFNAFMDHLPSSAFIKDENSSLVYVNQYLKDLFGADEWIGKPLAEIIPLELAQKMIEDDKRAFEKGLQVITEHLNDKNNVKRTFNTYKFPILRKGKLPLLGGLGIDITEQKEFEKKLIRSEEKYKLLFEATGTGIVQLEENGILSLVNRKFEEILGYSKEEVEGKKKWTDFVPKEELNRLAYYYKARREMKEDISEHYETKI